MLQQLAKLQQATLAARAATGMKGLGTEAAGGKFRVVLVTMAGRKTTVAPLSGFLPADAAIGVLRQIEADRGFKH